MVCLRMRILAYVCVFWPMYACVVLSVWQVGAHCQLCLPSTPCHHYTTTHACGAHASVQASRVGVRATPIRPPPRVVTRHPPPKRIDADPANTWAPLDLVALVQPRLRARCGAAPPKVLYVKLLLDAGGGGGDAPTGLGQWLRAKLAAVNHRTVHVLPGALLTVDFLYCCVQRSSWFGVFLLFVFLCVFCPCTA